MTEQESFTSQGVPSHCPGPENESAGKSAPCQGCPNQKICASGQLAGPDPVIPLIKARLAGVKHKILVLSGKGGVGKSSVTSMIARSLAESRDLEIAVVDIDICGPSMPKIMGMENESVHQSMEGWSPIQVDENLCMMSIGFLLGGPDDAVVWRGPRKNGIIKQFLKDVNWGSIDYMLFDTPPGTSDEHLSLVQYLSSIGDVDGVILVTTPQEVALSDVRKQVNFCRKVKLPILGVIENMSQFICPNCAGVSSIFPATCGGATKMCLDMNIPLIAKVPLDPKLAMLNDVGANFQQEYGNSLVSEAFANVVRFIKAIN